MNGPCVYEIMNDLCLSEILNGSCLYECSLIATNSELVCLCEQNCMSPLH